MKDLNFKNLQRATVFLLFAVLLFYILIVGQSVIVPLVVAFFLAFLLMPLAEWLERIGFSRVLAALTSLLSATVILAGIATLFGTQVKRFSKDLDEFGEKAGELVDQLPQALQDGINSFTNGGGMKFLEENISEIFAGLSGFASGFTFAIVVPIYVALILIYRTLLRNFLLRVFDGTKNRTDGEIEEKDGDKENDKEGIRHLIPRIKTIMQQYIVGMFYVICILFVLNSIALFSLGIEHAILFAAFAAVLNIIPFVGPLLGSIIPIIYALVTKDSLFYPIAVLGAFMIIQTAESNLLTPNIVGKNVSLNPLITLITLFMGAAVWGVIGMVLFIPLAAIVKEIMAHIDGLQAYAYVMGRGEEDDGPSVWKRLYAKIKN